MIAAGADIYVRRWQQYAKGLKRIGSVDADASSRDVRHRTVSTESCEQAVRADRLTGRMAFLDMRKKGAAGVGGEPAAREPGLGTGRGGDVTGIA